MASLRRMVKKKQRGKKMEITTLSVHFLCVKLKVKVLVTQSCTTLCDPIDCSPPGSSVHGILQAGIPEWVARPVSRGSSQCRDQTWVSCIAGRFFTVWATKEALISRKGGYLADIVLSSAICSMSASHSPKAQGEISLQSSLPLEPSSKWSCASSLGSRAKMGMG